MTKKNYTSRRQLLIDKCNSEQAVQLTNLRPVPNGNIFMNQTTSIKDLPAHSIPFIFQPLSSSTITDIRSLLEKHT